MIRNSTNQISIKPKMSARTRTGIIVGVIGGVVLALYLAYGFGVQTGHTQLEEDRNIITGLNETIQELRADLDKSAEELIIAQRHRQIQEEAYKQISNAYASSEQKNRYLGSRLDFYRSIISPEDGQSGPAIQALEAAQEGADVEFDLTLVQAIKHKHQVRGSLRVELFHDQQKVADWPLNNPRTISFQYFEQISGRIEAAQIVENARIRVELQLQDGGTLEKWFDVSPAS